MAYREKLAGNPAFERFERLTGLHLSEAEIEAYEQRAKKGGMTLDELFELASKSIERSLARLRSDMGTTLH